MSKKAPEKGIEARDLDHILNKSIYDTDLFKEDKKIRNKTLLSQQ